MKMSTQSVQETTVIHNQERRRALKRTLFLLFAVAATVAFAPFARAQYSFTTIDVPDAALTIAQGINNAGQIVGHYYKGAWPHHGFLFDRGIFTTIDYPGAEGGWPGTFLFGINDAGVIIGGHGPTALRSANTREYVPSNFVFLESTTIMSNSCFSHRDYDSSFLRGNRTASAISRLARCLVGTLLSAATLSQAQDGVLQAERFLSQMTLDEKIGQMTQVDMEALTDKNDIQKYFLGSMLSGGNSDPPDISAAGWLKAVEEYKSWALKTRLKIPLLYGIDAVHGHNNVDGAVIFPHNIGLGATHNPALVEQACRVTAEEVAGTGVQWVFGPCVAVAQNERWGRTYESFGDAPELAAELGAAAIHGLQGARLSDSACVLACAKHFIGDGGTEDGIDQGNAICDEATLRRLYLPPYIAAIKAGVGSIMVSYSSWNGQKMHGQKHLLTDVLKGELGFKGFLVSDWAAIDQLSKDYKHDIEVSINAGLDMVMIPNGPGKPNNYLQFITALKELVSEGKVPQGRIDDAVKRILTVKCQMGLFERAATESSLTAGVGSAAHRQAARECVRQSLVLLKNSNNALPLSKKLKRIAVAGKAADDLGIQCGGWTISWQGAPGDVTHGGTTILRAIRGAVGSDTEVTFAPDGMNVSGADAAVVVVGEMPYAEMKGDSTDLRLNARDAALVASIKKTGVPVVTIILSGRPLILDSTLDASDAVLAAWLPGTEGQGVADVLFGDYRPTGKLPRIWPRNNAQVDSAKTASSAALFPRGFGLSYQ